MSHKKAFEESRQLRRLYEMVLIIKKHSGVFCETYLFEMMKERKAPECTTSTINIIVRRMISLGYLIREDKRRNLNPYGTVFILSATAKIEKASSVFVVEEISGLKVCRAGLEDGLIVQDKTGKKFDRAVFDEKPPGKWNGSCALVDALMPGARDLGMMIAYRFGSGENGTLYEMSHTQGGGIGSSHGGASMQSIICGEARIL